MNFFELGKRIKQSASIPWKAVGEGALEAGGKFLRWGAPPIAGAYTAREMADRGYPLETAGMEGAAAALMANPALWKHYKNVGVANLANRGITNPNFWQTAEATGMAAKNPVKFKLLLGGAGLVPIATETMKNVKDITGQAHEASKNISRATTYTPGILSQITEATDPHRGVGKQLEGAAENIKNLLGDVRSGGKDIGGGVSAWAKDLGGRIKDVTQSQVDVNKAISKGLPWVVGGGLGIGGTLAAAKLIDALKARRSAKKRSTDK